MGSGPEGTWLVGPENALGERGAVASRLPGPELASRGWDPVMLSGPAWRSGARDASGSIGDMRNGVVNLEKMLNEGAQRSPQTLLHGVEIGLITRPRVGTLKVGRELMAQLLPGGERALRQVHEP
jgi:hypothetical protein